MVRQYNPQRFRYETIRGQRREVGTVPAGTILHVKGAKCIVECWHQREIGARRKVNGRWRPTFHARGGHLATVRRLRDGRRHQVADHILLAAIE